jgi:hypothetical protein
MNEDDVTLDSGQAGANAVATFDSANDQYADFSLTQGFASQGFLAFANDDANLVHSWVGRQRVDRMGQYRLGANPLKLFGDVASQPASRAGSDNQCRDDHGARLARSMAFM